jgi:O-antigen ligase
MAALVRRPAAFVLPVTGLVSLGVLFTYSRGGLVALVVALAGLWLALAARRLPARAPALALVTLLSVSAAFALSMGSSLPRPLPGMTAPRHAARYAPVTASLSFVPRELRAVPLTITNTGSRAWSAAALGCSWQRADAALAMDWQATSVCPMTPVPRADPGGTLRIDAVVRAPDAEGRYRLVFDLVADGWVLSSLGVEPATVPAVVSRSPVPAEAAADMSAPAMAARGRAALWRIAVAIWKEHPLTGIGPDNFRWVHAAHAGWPGRGTQDTLVPANNLFLEAAATTGTLGLLALLATLASTARAARAALVRAPGSAGDAESAADAVSAGVLLALTAGIVVHGLVDSLLGFTAHYLFLGLVVGAASSWSVGEGPTR